MFIVQPFSVTDAKDWKNLRFSFGSFSKKVLGALCFCIQRRWNTNFETKEEHFVHYSSVAFF